MVVLNMSTPGLLGIPHTHTLDALVFACNHAAIDEVYVAGKRRVSGGLHREQSMIAENFKSTMLELLG
jgi:formimidoylglutamate deiminase